MPDNVRENRQAQDARREAERRTEKRFTPVLKRRYHDCITGQGIRDFEELVTEAMEVLDGR